MQYPETVTLPEKPTAVYYQSASLGQRFGNFIIDFAVYWPIATLVFELVAFIIVSSWKIDFSLLTSQQLKPTMSDYAIAGLAYIGIYTLFEGASGGRSIGKWLTGTKVIKVDGSACKMEDAFFRSVFRLVPFEIFSGLDGHDMWHDKWTQTRVIKIE
jgi:uncharacterized RDD family membrane protein YckC